MRRVVVTGIGTVSSLGNNSEETASALREGRSGIEFIPEYEELGFRSHMRIAVNLLALEVVDLNRGATLKHVPAVGHLGRDTPQLEPGIIRSRPVRIRVEV